MPLADSGFGLLPVVAAAPALLQGFDCGKRHLNDFLAQAADLHARRLGLTSLVVHESLPGRVIGYFTLANDGLPLKTSEQAELGVEDAPLASYPAVKLCRLAVARELQGQGVGGQLIDLVHGIVLDARSLSAARIVIVDADNEPGVVRFYARHGYQVSLWAETRSRVQKSSLRPSPPAAIKMFRDVLA